MPSTYTNLGVQKMATGEKAGTWGTLTNTNWDIIQQAASGYHSQSLNLDGTGANTTPLAVALGDANTVTDALILNGVITSGAYITFETDGPQHSGSVLLNSTDGAPASDAGDKIISENFELCTEFVHI